MGALAAALVAAGRMPLRLPTVELGVTSASRRRAAADHVLLPRRRPVAVAERLRPAVEQRWAGGDVVPLLAAPFHVPVDFDWGRHLP